MGRPALSCTSWTIEPNFKSRLRPFSAAIRFLLSPLPTPTNRKDGSKGGGPLKIMSSDIMWRLVVGGGGEEIAAEGKGVLKSHRKFRGGEDAERCE